MYACPQKEVEAILWPLWSAAKRGRLTFSTREGRHPPPWTKRQLGVQHQRPNCQVWWLAGPSVGLLLGRGVWSLKSNCTLCNPSSMPYTSLSHLSSWLKCTTLLVAGTELDEQFPRVTSRNETAGSRKNCPSGCLGRFVDTDMQRGNCLNDTFA